MRYVLTIIFFLLINKTEHTNIYGKYSAYIKFPQHSFYETIKIKKNGTFKIKRSATTVNPSSTSTGLWTKSHDSIFLITRKIIINKHKKSKKTGIYCNVGEFNELIGCFKKDTLIVKNEDLFHMSWNILFTKN